MKLGFCSANERWKVKVYFYGMLSLYMKTFKAVDYYRAEIVQCELIRGCDGSFGLFA